MASPIHQAENGAFFGVWADFAVGSAFQPIFRFSEGRLKIAAFEGLARPVRNGGPVPPAEFFRLIPAQDRMAVETLTRDVHLRNAGRFLDPDTYLFVNFDPTVFGDRSITMSVVRELTTALDVAEIERRRVVCELTEKRTFNLDDLADFVSVLRSNRFKIAIDDYGAEDSDIRRIELLKPDLVKFDAGWITSLMENEAGPGLLQAMVAKFRDRGIINLFEGIEEDWQLVMADELGVDLVQGFVVAKPELAPTSFSIFSRGKSKETRNLPPLKRVTSGREILRENAEMQAEALRSMIVPGDTEQAPEEQPAAEPVQAKPGRPVFGRRAS